MILVDANLLIYAVDADSTNHARARQCLEQMLSGDSWVGLPWIALLAFLRTTTRAGIMRKQLTPEQAAAFSDAWLAQPYVVAIGPDEADWAILKNLLLSGGTAGNLTSDVHLAALAIEHGCRIASADNDFRRFAGVTLVNPLIDD